MAPGSIQPHCPSENAEKGQGRPQEAEQAMLNGLRQLGDGAGGEVEETELLKTLSREVEPAGPSNFMFALDPVDESAGVTPDPLSGELQELVASSEGQGLNGANGGAGRFTAFAADDVRTEGALAHARGDRVRIFVFGHLKRAGDHAIAASDTLRYIVEYRSVIPSLKGPYNACGDAGRLEAVHALGLDKDGNGPVSFIKPPGVEPIDHGEFRRFQPGAFDPGRTDRQRAREVREAR